ncbi:MAG TPA: signal peptidase I [Actinomycetota bacterium]|nr:signal peptidase I [Actinomycetota bacterium]
MESQHAPPPPPPATEAETEVVPAVEEAEPQKKKHSFWRELPVLVVIAFVVALLIKTYLLQAFYIPSASMEPTLVEGDRVLVEKLSYRWGEPERGDVVVFEKEFATVALTHDDPFWEDIASALKGLFGFPTGGTQDFIKRVMAVEGDTIEGREGRVYVNGEPVEEPYLTEGTETSPFGPVEVPEDMIFVMGDNRGNSDDSRAFGPIPVDEVVGHAFLLLWPPSDFDTL